MSRTIYHFALEIQGGVQHSYYTSLEGLILDNEEDLNCSRSKLQKWSASGERELTHENWIIRRGEAHTTSEIRKYWEAVEELGPEGFETDQ